MVGKAERVRNDLTIAIVFCSIAEGLQAVKRSGPIDVVRRNECGKFLHHGSLKGAESWSLDIPKHCVITWYIRSDETAESGVICVRRTSALGCASFTVRATS